MKLMPEWFRIRISQVLVKRLRDEYLHSRTTAPAASTMKKESEKVS